MGCPEGKIPSSLGSQFPAYQQSSGADRIFLDLKVNNGRWLHIRLPELLLLHILRRKALP